MFQNSDESSPQNLVGENPGARIDRLAEKEDENCAAINRFRELGVSFLQKDDLVASPRDPPNQPKYEASMFYHPTAVETQMSSVTTRNYSTVFNSYGQRYLGDSQLALYKTDDETASLSSQQRTTLEPANVTRYGLPEDEMSTATRNLLDNTKYMTRPQ